jgi:hypothetical protein
MSAYRRAASRRAMIVTESSSQHAGFPVTITRSIFSAQPEAFLMTFQNGLVHDRDRLGACFPHRNGHDHEFRASGRRYPSIGKAEITV